MKRVLVLVFLLLVVVIQSAPGAPQKYPFQTPANLPEGSAERVLAQFIGSWRDQDWARMVKFTEVSWRKRELNPAKTLAASYDFRPLKGFKIESVKHSSISSDVTYTIWYKNLWSKIIKKHVTARVIKETTAGEISQDGTWGVNPISALAERD
jgi:hypothetical protein